MSKYLTILETEDYEVHARVKYGHRAKRPTIYVTAADPDLVQPPYGSTRGDGSEDDKAWKAYNRAEVRGQKNVLEAIKPLLKKFEIADGPFDGESAEHRQERWDNASRNEVVDALQAKAHFSRTAGCSCGCSPGFKAEFKTSYNNIEVWVTDRHVRFVHPDEMERTVLIASSVDGETIPYAEPMDLYDVPDAANPGMGTYRFISETDFVWKGWVYRVTDAVNEVADALADVDPLVYFYGEEV